jgi:hypothetical protein
MSGCGTSLQRNTSIQNNSEPPQGRRGRLRAHSIRQAAMLKRDDLTPSELIELHFDPLPARGPELQVTELAVISQWGRPAISQPAGC